MLDQKAPHSMCVSFRLQASELRDVEQSQEGKTLSSTMEPRIVNTLNSLVRQASEGISND